MCLCVRLNLPTWILAWGSTGRIILSDIFCIFCRIQRLIERGITEKWMRNYWPKPVRCSNERKFSLGLGDVQGVFFNLTGLLFFSTLTLVAEVLCNLRSIRISSLWIELQKHIPLWNSMTTLYPQRHFTEGPSKYDEHTNSSSSGHITSTKADQNISSSLQMNDRLRKTVKEMIRTSKQTASPSWQCNSHINAYGEKCMMHANTSGHFTLASLKAQLRKFWA